MSKYNVSWHQPSRTLVISNTDVEVSGDAEVVSHIVYGDLGEVPDSASHPEPGQHLRNIALQQGVDDYDLVTVVNETDNNRLDRFVKQGDEAKLARLQDEEATKVIDNHKRDEDEKAIANADKVGPIGDRHADEGSENGEANGDTSIPAYDDITVKQIKERLTASGKTFDANASKRDLYDLLGSDQASSGSTTDHAGGEEGSADADAEQTSS
jgi:hypothetical protein